MKIVLDITYRKGPEYKQNEYLEIIVTEDDLIKITEAQLAEGYSFNAPKIRELKIKRVDFGA